MTVLLAEQDLLMHHTLRAMLGRAGFDVVDVAAPLDRWPLAESGGAPAVLVASTRPGRGATFPDLVLGAKRWWPRLRVVLASGGTVDPGEMALADRFLPKPFSGKALIQAVTELAEAGRPPALAPCTAPAQGYAI